MENLRAHIHPLNTAQPCCEDHVFELISVFTQQKRDQEILSLLLQFASSIETRFLLDNSEHKLQLKLQLGKLYNKFALIKGLELDEMRSLFETAFDIYSSLPETTENLGFLATANSNLAYIARCEGELKKACKYLDQVALIEKKIGDTTGTVMTKINKAAILNDMESYLEAFHTIKDATTRLETKLQQFLVSESDDALRSNKKFIETLQLLLIAYINMISALENSGKSSMISEAKSKKLIAIDYCRKYLGDSNYLASYFTKVRLKTNMSLSSFSSNFELNSAKSSVKEPKIQEKPKPDPSAASQQRSKTPIKEFQVPEKQSADPPKSTQKSSPKSSSNLPSQNLNAVISPTFIEKSPESQGYVRRKFIKTSQNSSISRNTSESRLIIKSNKPSQADSSESLEIWESSIRIIRLPGSKLPEIPPRACRFRNNYKYLFNQPTAPKSYEYLLDPLKSSVSKQLDFSVAGVKISNDITRVIVCCLQIENNLVHLCITSEAQHDQVLTSEYIKLKDLQSILFYLCVFDVIPSYMHPGFINSFEKFVQYYLMPFVRVVTVEENQSEKIELWARGESLMPNDTSQVFLDTACTIALYYIEEGYLKMVIMNSNEEESSEKSIRVDLHMDKAAAEALIKQQIVPEKYKDYRCIQTMQPLDPRFIEQLDSVISEIELCIKDEFGPRINFDGFIERNNFVIIRADLLAEKSEKMLWTVQNRFERRVWEVKVKRLHRVNSSRRKRNFVKSIFYPYSLIYSNFGIRINKLEQQELQILAYYVLQTLKVDIPTEDDIDDLENEGSIIICNIKALKSIRIFSKDAYKVPITISVVGVNNCLIGVRASSFTIETCSESSAWFLLDESFYRYVQPKMTKKTEKFKGVLNIKLHETRLIEILEKERGWEKLTASLKPEKELMFIQTASGPRSFESIRTVLNKK